jgi:hypothetical protein
MLLSCKKSLDIECKVRQFLVVSPIFNIYYV